MSKLDRTAIAVADRKLLTDILSSPVVQVLGWTAFMMAVYNKELKGTWNILDISQGGTLLDRFQAGTMWAIGLTAIAVAHVPDKGSLVSSLKPSLKLG